MIVYSFELSTFGHALEVFSDEPGVSFTRFPVPLFFPYWRPNPYRSEVCCVSCLTGKLFLGPLFLLPSIGSSFNLTKRFFPGRGCRTRNKLISFPKPAEAGPPLSEEPSLAPPLSNPKSFFFPFRLSNKTRPFSTRPVSRKARYFRPPLLILSLFPPPVRAAPNFYFPSRRLSLSSSSSS